MERDTNKEKHANQDQIILEIKFVGEISNR